MIGRRYFKWIVVAIVLVGAVAIAVPNLLSVIVNTDGVAFEYRDVTGGSNAVGSSDLLDTTAYVTSWTAGGLSEKIVIQGYYKNTAGWDFDPDMKEYWYVVTLGVDNPDVKINGVTGTTWTSPRYAADLGDPNLWQPGIAVTLQITNPCTGMVHVEMYGRVMDLNPFSSDDGLLALDEAYLRSGIGSIVVNNDVVEEGTEVSFYVKTGYAHSTNTLIPASDQGWYLDIKSPSGTKVYSTTLQDNFADTLKWLVPMGSYSSTSSNIYTIVLRNELIDQDDDIFFTVGQGMIEEIPEKPSFSIVEGSEPFLAGESIKVRLRADVTTYPISGFWVWVSYETSTGSTTHYLLQEAWYVANPTDADTYEAYVSFTFPDAGFVRFEASTVDINNLNSGIAELRWTVDEADEGGTVDEPDDDYDWAGVLILAGCVLVAFLIYWRVPLPMLYKLLLVMAILGVGAYFAYPYLEAGPIGG